MASQTAIANRALDKIGEQSIVDIADNVKSARALRRMWDIVRDAELRQRKWSFSIKRALLAADVAVPVFGYGAQYQLPTDCLRTLNVGEFDMSLDLSDYHGSPSQAFVIEGRKILMSRPGGQGQAQALPLRYTASIADTTLWDSTFVEAFACRLAAEVAEALTQSSDKRRMAWQEYQQAISAAKRANALELPSDSIVDDTWILARLRG